MSERRPPQYVDDTDEGRRTVKFSALRRQQAKRRREVLTEQMSIWLKAQSLPLLNQQTFKRVERLAIRVRTATSPQSLRQHRLALRQFLAQQADKLRDYATKKRVDEAVKSWLRFFKIGGPGRPRGTGHPKAKLPTFGFSPRDLATLEQALSERDRKLLFAVIRTGSQKGAAKELRVTPQAVNKRWRRKIWPALQRVNPHFSLTAFRAAVADRTSK